MEICKKYISLTKKIIFILLLLFFTQTDLTANTFDDLKDSKKTSYLDFVLLKIEQRLIQRHGLLGPQPVALRVQYQSIGSQVDFIEEDSRIVISIVGVMNKQRYSEKKYIPKLQDCNVLRNMLLYGKYGYSLIFQKRNKYLTNIHMEEIFIGRFLNNLSLSDKEKEFILKNTYAKVQVIDPVRGKDFYCTGKISEELQ